MDIPSSSEKNTTTCFRPGCDNKTIKYCPRCISYYCSDACRKSHPEHSANCSKFHYVKPAPRQAAETQKQPEKQPEVPEDSGNTVPSRCCNLKCKKNCIDRCQVCFRSYCNFECLKADDFHKSNCKPLPTGNEMERIITSFHGKDALNKKINLPVFKNELWFAIPYYKSDILEAPQVYDAASEEMKGFVKDINLLSKPGAIRYWVKEKDYLQFNRQWGLKFKTNEAFLAETFKDMK